MTLLSFDNVAITMVITIVIGVKLHVFICTRLVTDKHPITTVIAMVMGGIAVCGNRNFGPFYSRDRCTKPGKTYIFST